MILLFMVFHNIAVVINVSINKTLDDSVIVKPLFMLKKILTNQNECTQIRIDFDYEGFHKLWTLQIKMDGCVLVSRTFDGLIMKASQTI